MEKIENLDEAIKEIIEIKKFLVGKQHYGVAGKTRLIEKFLLSLKK